MPNYFLSGKIVVYDTNVYRILFHQSDVITKGEIIDIINQIRNKEQAIGLSAYLQRDVLMELLCHLDDLPITSSYRDCFASVVGAYWHCLSEHTKFGYPRAVPSMENQISKFLINETDKESEELNSSVIGVAKDLFILGETGIRIHKTDGTFAKIAKFLKFGESNFTESIIEMSKRIDSGTEKRILKRNPKSDIKSLKQAKLRLFNNMGGASELSLAIQMVTTAYKSFGISVSNETIVNQGISFLNSHSVPVIFLLEILKDLNTKTTDMRGEKSKIKRHNWIWDYSLSYVLAESCIAGKDIILVTNDMFIYNVAQKTNRSALCVKPKDYFMILGLEKLSSLFHS